MKIEIDQSWKFEDTQKPTIIAFSNSKSDAIIILSREKKLIQNYFRKIKKPRLFAILGFIILIYILIKDKLKNGDHIEIDKEYPGYEKLIRQTLTKILMNNTRIKDVHISSTLIGKKSQAHVIAYSGFKNRSKIVIKKISAQDVIDIIKRNKKSGSV